MADYALAMMQGLVKINKDSFNDFQLQVGKCNITILSIGISACVVVQVLTMVQS